MKSSVLALLSLVASCQGYYTAPSFIWSPMKETVLGGQKYITEGVSTSDVANLVSYIGGGQLPPASPFIDSLGARSSHTQTPAVILIFLQDNLRTDEVTRLSTQHSNAFSFIKETVTHLPSTLSLPYVTSLGTSEDFLTSLLSCAPTTNIVVAGERVIGGLTPDMKVSEVVTFITQALPHTDKVTYLIVDLGSVSNGQLLADAQAADSLMRNINGVLSKATKKNYVGMLAASSPSTSFPREKVSFSSLEESVASHVPKRALAAGTTVQYTGLYVSSDILTFLLIFGLLVIFYYLGLSLLLSVQSNEGMEVQPPPVGKEM